MTYQESLDYLFSRLPMFSRIGAAAYKPGLERVEALSLFFSNPEKKFKSIHIAGTNGKGSTSHMLASVLQAAGFKVGLYTSPHLVDFRERIRINGEMISEEEVVEFVEKWKSADYAGDPPSFFELTMMMAFDLFAKKEVDYAVIETGMGGRLDSTNIISPILSVITNISKDHTQFLGSTFPEIAAEKAGIIKRGIPVVIGEAEGDVERVFIEKAETAAAPLHRAYQLRPLSDFRLREDLSGWECRSPDIGDIFVDLAGDYQPANITSAFTALLILRQQGIEIPDDAIRKGLASVGQSTGLRGRWMVIDRKPLTICDTGHNIAGLRYNMTRLKSLISSRPNGCLRLLIGFVADKAIDEILGLLPKDAVYYITNADIPRAFPATELYRKCIEEGLHGDVYASVKEAYQAMHADAGPDDILYIGGSTFIVADFLK